MQAVASVSDQLFRQQFESGEISPSEFDHRGHLRLAYTYLCGSTVDAACDSMRTAIRQFLQRNAVDPAKYHETLTVAWLGAVRHFMQLAGSIRSFEELIQADPRLLDQQIMLTHYSRDVLFSELARSRFVAPDIDPIPAY